MRSVNKFAKVEGHTALVRDMSSSAIISTNDSEYNNYMKRRETEKRRQETIDSQVQQIDCLKNEMLEIKQLLSQLLQTKGQ